MPNNREINRCLSTHTHVIEIRTSPVGSPTDPRSLDRYSLDELEEMNKQLLAEIVMSTPHSSTEMSIT